MPFALLWLSLSYLNLFHISTASGCGHISPSPKEVKHVFIESVSKRQKRETDVPTHSNLRIALRYDDSVHELPSDQQTLLKETVMNKAIIFWENALKTRPLSRPIKLARDCIGSLISFKPDGYSPPDLEPYCSYNCSAQTFCGDTIVPEEHLQGCRTYDVNSNTYYTEPSDSAGVADADFLLYVASKDTERCDSTIAYATYCELEVEYDRPVAGFINICSKGLSTHESQLQLSIATIKHEILHALGFSLNLYAFYRDSNGEPLTNRTEPGNRPKISPSNRYVYSDRVVKQVTRTDWKTVQNTTSRTVSMMVTPRVVEEVRRHFNCSSLEGAELENQGPVGTVLTHWEKRVFENEVMTGIYTQNPVVSRITLALMEDTGWYVANYSLAEHLEWGEKLGCSFAKKSCYDWISTKERKGEPVHPYCTEMKNEDMLKTECTTQRTAVSLCNMVAHGQVDPAYQVSNTNPSLGGIVVLADYCPYLQEFNWNKDGEFVRGSTCGLSVNTPHDDSDFAAEYYGPGSKCFDQTEAFTMSRCNSKFTSNNYGSGCYKYSCSEETGLTIQVGSQAYRCYKEGQLLNIKTTTEFAYHEGTLVCPSCTEICQGEITTCPADSEPPQVSSDGVQLEIPCSAHSAHSTDSSLIYVLLVVLYNSYCFRVDAL